jgi:hypothetical protein
VLLGFWDAAFNFLVSSWATTLPVEDTYPLDSYLWLFADGWVFKCLVELGRRLLTPVVSYSVLSESGLPR